MSDPMHTNGDERPGPRLVPQRHGGALLTGALPGNAGGGRPKDAIRARLRNIARGQSIPFLRGLFTGDVRLRFVGTCPGCGHESEIDSRWTDSARAAAVESVRARLMASEQALKYGVGTQTETVTRDEIEREARAMLNVMVDWAREKWGRSTEEVQALAEAMSRAASR